jgi:hypothetical protein
MTAPISLWIDDLRPTPAGYTHTAVNSSEAISILETAKITSTPVALISFDHDLGGDDTTRRVLLWMIEHDVWPAQIRIHTANPVGREWLTGMATRYSPDITQIVY